MYELFLFNSHHGVEFAAELIGIAAWDAVYIVFQQIDRNDGTSYWAFGISHSIRGGLHQFPRSAERMYIYIHTPAHWQFNKTEICRLCVMSTATFSSSARVREMFLPTRQESKDVGTTESAAFVARLTVGIYRLDVIQDISQSHVGTVRNRV